MKLLLSSQTARWVLALRLWLLFHSSTWLLPEPFQLLLLDDEVSDALDSNALRSVLIRPAETPQAIQDAVALRELVANDDVTKFADSYALLPYHHPTALPPPLVLAALEPLVAKTTTTSSTDGHDDDHPTILWGLLLLVAELLIAQKLTQIAAHQQNRLLDHSQWEHQMEQSMPEPIRPPHKWPFHCDDDDDDDDEPSSSQTDKKEDTQTQQLASSQYPILVGLLYFASPVTSLTASFHGCYQNLRVLCMVGAICEALRCSSSSSSSSRYKSNSNNHSKAGSAVATATWLGGAILLDAPLALILILPLFLLLPTGRQRTAFLLGTTLIVAIMGAFTFLLVGQRVGLLTLLISTTGVSMEGVAPSLSFLWYMQMELFARFSKYFQILLTGLPATLVLPTAIRLHRYPMTMITILWVTWTLFRPVGTLYEVNVSLCLVALCPRTLVRMNDLICIVALAALVIPALLFVVLHWMWLQVGNGEANFLFFQALAYNILVLVLLWQFVAATVARDKANCLTEKQQKHQLLQMQQEPATATHKDGG